MRPVRVLLLSSILGAFAGGGCAGKSSAPTATAGPIDGTWNVTSITCNGGANIFPTAGLASIHLVIADSTGSEISSFNNGCVGDEATHFAYPSSTEYTSLAFSNTCTGSCSGECIPSGTQGNLFTRTYSVSGSTLTFTQISIHDEGCGTGQTAAFTLTKL